ncbi:MAG: glycosyltransferase family 2 protein [Candidatus Hydrogenedentes bacterium]|nr:glycosyltransferase family 2 protein [Candidatus Hydrogenedentota bacterium]
MENATEKRSTVDVIVVSFNTKELLRDCLRSIAATCQPPLEARVCVVDNASSDGSPEMVRREFQGVHLIVLDENLGFGAANNRGLHSGNAEYVLFLNSDAQLTESALAALVAFMEQHLRCAAVGPRLAYADGRFQASCRRFPNLLRNFWSLSGLQARCPGHLRSLQNWLSEDEHTSGRLVDMVSGACFLARRAYLEQVGGFDENLFLYEEETDLFLPARRKAWEVRHCSEAKVIHLGGSSVEANELKAFSRFHAYRSKYYVFRKHYGAWTSRLAYWSDLLVFAISTIVSRLRGKESRAGERSILCRKAYRYSFSPMSQLRTPGL